MIRKLKSGEYRLYSKKIDPKTGKRKNLGTFETREAAAKHERTVQYFNGALTERGQHHACWAVRLPRARPQKGVHGGAETANRARCHRFAGRLVRQCVIPEPPSCRPGATS